MTQPATRSARTLRLVLVALGVAQLLALAAVLLLLRSGRLLALDIAQEHAVAYAWVVFTVVAAVAAYVLAIRGPRGEGVALARGVAAAGLADAAAFAGIFGFYLVRVWPMLVVAALAALLGPALGLPLARMVEEAAAGPQGGAPRDAQTLETAGTT